jgi:phenylalanyl-tRNA synthetase beta chain
MNVSHDWLKAFVPHDLAPAALRDLLTSRVVTVDEIVPLRADLAPIVVARVVEAARHPDSDHLWVTRVDAGGPEPLDVVCGAPNVAAGKLYPFAPTGTTMPNGMKIERRKIRGALSDGMLCSARELGLGEGHEGILELAVDSAPGTPLLRALAVGDTRIVLDVTPNRPDLLSHLGVARELASALGRPMSLPRFDGDEAPVAPAASNRKAGRAGSIVVHLEDSLGGAPRYVGATIRGAAVGPSPEWLVRRLESVGVRSINNVVDATNYLLHELGQPMHAFDASVFHAGDLPAPTVVVRRAKAGETLVTLDGVERKLDPRMLVIADAERVHALAGVMGGRDSEVTERTTDIFLEVATFDPKSTRHTRRATGLSTDASHRFERGTDPELPGTAWERAVRLILSLAGGQLEGAVDLVPAPSQRQAIVLRAARVARLLGTRVPADECVALLRSIGFEARLAPGTEMLRGEEELVVVPPSWRRDVVLEVDLVEEVARLHGYDALPSDVRPFRPGTVPDAPLWITSRRVRETLVGAGLLETRPLPFVRGGDEGHLRVVNPIAENEPYLRTSVLDTLARRAEHNLAHMQRNVRIFEIGAAFQPGSGNGDLPREETRVAILVMGDRRPPHFTEPRPPAWDEWDAKALGELAATSAYPARPAELRPGEGARLWSIVVDGETRGEVRRLALDAPVWAAPAFGVELTLERTSARAVAPPGRTAYDADGARGAAGVSRYRPLPVTPAVEVDLALLVPDQMPAAHVESVVRRAAGELLERVVLFDEYRGAGVPGGFRSVAWRLTFRHPERTLREKEIEGRREKLLRTLEAELGVRQRSA